MLFIVTHASPARWSLVFLFAASFAACGDSPVALSLTLRKDAAVDLSLLKSVEMSAYRTKTLDGRTLGCEGARDEFSKDPKVVRVGTVVSDGLTGSLTLTANGTDVLLDVSATDQPEGLGNVLAVGCGLLSKVQAGQKRSVTIDLVSP